MVDHNWNKIGVATIGESYSDGYISQSYLTAFRQVEPDAAWTKVDPADHGTSSRLYRTVDPRQTSSVNYPKNQMVTLNLPIWSWLGLARIIVTQAYWVTGKLSP